MARAARFMKLSQGVIFLAQKSGAAVVPMNMEYSSCLAFEKLGPFLCAAPFSTVRVIFGAPHPSRANRETRRIRERTAALAKCDDESGGAKMNRELRSVE